MQDTICEYTRKCPLCQKCKHTKRSHGKFPEKNVQTKPWHTLCVDLIGPYTLKRKDGSEVDFMCLTIIDAATGWLEIVELTVVEKPLNKKGKIVCQETFDKTSGQMSQIVNKPWFCRYP